MINPATDRMYGVDATGDVLKVEEQGAHIVDDVVQTMEIAPVYEQLSNARLHNDSTNGMTVTTSATKWCDSIWDTSKLSQKTLLLKLKSKVAGSAGALSGTVYASDSGQGDAWYPVSTFGPLNSTDAWVCQQSIAVTTYAKYITVAFTVATNDVYVQAVGIGVA